MKKMFVKALRAASRCGPVIGGIATVYAWQWLHYWGGPFSLRFLSMDLANTRWVVNLAACALGMAAVFILTQRGWEGEWLTRILRGTSLACGILGTSVTLVLLTGTLQSSLPTGWLALAAGMFTGIATACSLCYWCCISALLGVRWALACNMLGLATGGGAFLICMLVPSWFSLTVGVACPLVWFLCSNSRCLPLVPSDSNTSVRRPLTRRNASRWLAQWKIILAVAVLFGISNGFLGSSFEVVPVDLYRVSCFGVVAATIIASALAFLATFVLHLNAWQLVFKISLPLIALGYFMLPYEAFWYVGIGTHAVGYQFFFITFWSLLGADRLRCEMSVACSVSAGLAVTEAGTALGALLWDVAFTGIDAQGVSLVAAVAPMLALLAAVAFGQPDLLWKELHPGISNQSAWSSAVLEHAVNALQATYGLSPREADVCRLLSRGHSRREVSEKLSVSLETARTHTSNVYRKLNVHSQQELAALVDRTASECMRGGYDVPA